MFDSLSDQIRKDEQQQSTRAQRVIQGMVVAVLSILLFAGLYFSIKLVE